jgi:hypothetical protein
MGQLMAKSNALKGAFDAFQMAAPRDLKAIVGQAGMRQSKDMLNKIINADIPRMQDDPLPYAVQRLENVRTLLDTAEVPIMSRNWRGTAPPAPAITPPQPNANLKAQAMVIGRTGDIQGFINFIKANPSLNEDADLTRMAKMLASRQKVAH